MNNEQDTRFNAGLEEDISHLASRWLRLWAAIIDSIIMMCFTVPILYFTGAFEQISAGIQPPLMYTILTGLAGLLGFYLININLLLTKGQTIGRKVSNIKIVDLNNNLPTKTHLLKRYSVYLSLAYIPIIGEWLSLINILFIFGKEKRCVHDLVGQTKVVNSQKLV